MDALLCECIRKTEHLTRKEAIILRDLLSHGLCSHERLFDQGWGHDPEGGPLSGRRLVVTYIWRLRRKLVPWLRIDNEFGWGYRLTGSIKGMTMKDQLIEDLKRDEGFRAHAYQDSEGYWTIGYGRLIDAKQGGGISIAEAEFLMANDIERFGAEVDRTFPWWREMPDDAQRAFANMAFNLGITRLGKFKKMLAALQSGDFLRAGDEAEDSKWAGQVGPRAERIAELFRGCT